MKYLYMDNYRGFSKSLIPLADVIFLVGENSTGKTSFLSALYLLNRPEFWITADFSLDASNSSGFTDLVSARSKNKSYFALGEFSCESGKARKISGGVISFKNDQGLPSPDCYTYLSDDKVVRVQIDKDGFRYWTRSIAKILKDSDEARDAINQVLAFHDGSDLTAGRLLKLPARLPAFTLLSSAAALVDAKISREAKSDASYSIRIPNKKSYIWLAPIRTRPRRTYGGVAPKFSPEGEHTPYLLKSKLTGVKARSDFEKRLNEIGRLSNLFDSIDIKSFSTEPAAPFEVRVKFGQYSIPLDSVGYGVSQALPIMTELLDRPRDTRFMLQQPEVHLHPKAQAELGGVIQHLAREQKKKFIVETHSDFLIDRYRKSVADAGESDVSASVVFFERGDRGNSAYEIRIERNGSYSEEQPEGFRAFFVNEAIQMMGV